jgi:hypothetical protein
VAIFTKRNALVGYITLKRLKRRRQQKSRALKLVAFVMLAVISAGILAAVAAAVIRRQKDAQNGRQEAQHLEGYAVADDAAEVGSSDSVEFDVELPEPGSAA